MDIDTKALKKNAFRVTKVRGVTSSRIRVPGGLLKAEYLGKIQEIAEKYGNGTVNLTARQGFEGSYEISGHRHSGTTARSIIPGAPSF